MIKNFTIVILSLTLIILAAASNRKITNLNSELNKVDTKDEVIVGAVADDVMTELNRIISDLNTSYWKLDNYYEDWATLPAGVKTTIKNKTVQKIDTTISDLQAVKTQINNF